MLTAMTGATGFAGRHAVSEFLSREHSLRVLVRDPARADLPAAVQVVPGGLESAEALRSLVAGADAVVHLAGSISAVRREDYFRVNEAGTAAVAEAARDAGMKRFVHISSLAAREPELSDYGASKWAGEEAVKRAASQMPLLIIRPPAVYGPGDRATLPLLKSLISNPAIIPSSPHSRFSLIHVHDLARLIADAAESPVTGLAELSDGTVGGYTWSDLIRISSEVEGRAIQPLFLPRGFVQMVALAADGVARITGKPGMVSRSKVGELYHHDWVSAPGPLALSDPITFARGFPETLKWYRDAGWLPRRAAADRSRPKPRSEASP
ncbi:NAD-dependent epimerase/dehydratase family protein [Aestuariivirga sp.]|uniref:NAD-dependent epimerase/dehydratase family protein n=1 Tax=Aestuariivirga sp. TaxID=2650926 RepID=UPI0039E2D17C